MGRQHQGIDRLGVRQVPEGSGEQGKMEKTGCKIICGALTTFVVKGLMMMINYYLSTFPPFDFLLRIAFSFADKKETMLSGHIHPNLQTLPWLQVTCRIQDQISTVCFSSLFGTAPRYRSDLIQPYTPTRPDKDDLHLIPGPSSPLV